VIIGPLAMWKACLVVSFLDTCPGHSRFRHFVDILQGVAIVSENGPNLL
jgi:hypothetical protein